MCSSRIVAIGKVLAERCFQFHFHYSDIRKHLYAPIRVFATMQQHLLFYRTVFRSQPPILRENCQSASRGWVQLLRFSHLPVGVRMLCVPIRQMRAQNPVTAVAGSGIPTKGCFDCVQPRLISISKWDKESALSASMIPSQIALGWGLVGRIEQRVRLISWRSICFHSTSFISEVAEARVDNRPKYPALGFDSNFGSFRINEQCRESSA